MKIGLVIAFHLCVMVFVANAQITLTTDTLQPTGTPAGYYTLRIYATSSNATDVVNAVVGSAEYPLSISVQGGDVWNHPTFGVTNSGEINCNLLPIEPLFRFDSYVTIGDTCGDNNTLNVIEDPNASQWLNPFFQPIDSSSNIIVINSVIGGGWFVTDAGASSTMGDDLKVLIAQITTNGTVCGILNLQVEDTMGLNTLHTGLSFGPEACSGVCSMIANCVLLQPLCPGSLGAVEAIPAGGYPPYVMYLNGVEQMSLTTNDLAPGPYVCAIQDAFGCVFQDTIEIISVEPIVVNGLMPLPISALPGGNTNYYISGGTPPYAILWTGPNGFNSSENNLPPLTDENQSGNYVITITDMNGCVLSESLFITELNEMDANKLRFYPNPCKGLISLEGNGSGRLSLWDLSGRSVPFSLRGNSTDGVIIQIESGAGTYILSDDVLGWKTPILILD